MLHNMYVQDAIFLGLGAIMLWLMHGAFHEHGHGDGHGAEGAGDHAAEAAAHDDHAAHHGPSYLTIFWCLVVLTLIELGVPPVMGKGTGLSLAVLITLAVIKAGLVAMYFMHLRTEGRGIFGVVGLTIVCVGLALGPIMWDINVVYGMIGHH